VAVLRRASWAGHGPGGAGAILSTTDRGQAMAAMAEDTDLSSLTPDMRARLEQRAQQMLAEPQQVPMMRVTTHQSLPVIRVEPFNQYQRNRYWQPF